MTPEMYEQLKEAAEHCADQLRNEVHPDGYALLCRALVTQAWRHPPQNVADDEPGVVYDGLDGEDQIDRTLRALDSLAGKAGPGVPPTFMWFDPGGPDK